MKRVYLSRNRFGFGFGVWRGEWLGNAEWMFAVGPVVFFWLPKNK